MKSFPRMASFPGSRLEAVAGMEIQGGLTGDHWVILTAWARDGALREPPIGQSCPAGAASTQPTDKGCRASDPTETDRTPWACSTDN